ncbi:Mitochondrial carrier protein [Novymonas esmeraldas]|uniref:Mitochondrial carrier protein n=1 Tax=Novymonas esmeraldas TaxID=1808958 RepID=A0AAW0ETN7_9TRYP
MSGASSSSPGLTNSVKDASHAGEGQHRDGFAYSAGPALISGASQAILFNPIDRALYVRVKFRRRRFLDKRNFERPFQGFMNAMVYRTLVGASYMFWQDSMRIAIERFAPAACQASTAPQLNSMLIGLSAGAVNGFALNTLQAVKFRMWNTDARGITFLRTAVHMYGEGGLAIFFRGCVTTMVRDSVFGIVYETARRASAWKSFFDSQVDLLYRIVNAATPAQPPKSEASLSVNETASVHHDSVLLDPSQRCGMCTFLSNLVAAVLASIMSSPFNYVRSIVYGTPAGAIPLGYVPLLKSFYTQLYYTYRHGRSYTDRHGVPELGETEHRWRHGSAGGAEATEEEARRAARRAAGAAARAAARVRTWTRLHRHHPIAAWTWANSRLNIGWGSLRVGFGMAMSQSLFYLAQDYARTAAR